MSKFAVGAVCVALSVGLLIGNPSKARGDDDKTNDVVGAIWQYEAHESFRKTAKLIRSGRFRATLDGKVYNLGADQIGTYNYTNKARDGVKLKIDKGKLKGTINLTKTQNNPQTWLGNWMLEDGTRAKLVIKMIRD